jgi:transcriptional regulator with XRE-family HTH domain
MSMTAQEAARAREQLGLSVEDLAADLAFTPDVVRLWESGKAPVPRRVTRLLEWELAAEERYQALVESGLPDCEWMNAWERETVPENSKAQAAHMERVVKHAESCSVCKTREEFIAGRFGKMPAIPVSGSMGALLWIGNRIEKLPRVVQPAAWVGLAFGSYSMLRIAFWVPAMIREPRVILTALTGLSASMAIGASLGLVYSGFSVAKQRFRNRSTERRAA